jgi:imidazoleglycerol-phosphate dehydratase
MSDTTQQPARTASIERKTNETDISIKVNLDSKMDQQIDIATGIGFLDHV